MYIISTLNFLSVAWIISLSFFTVLIPIPSIYIFPSTIISDNEFLLIYGSMVLFIN